MIFVVSDGGSLGIIKGCIKDVHAHIHVMIYDTFDIDDIYICKYIILIFIDAWYTDCWGMICGVLLISCRKCQILCMYSTYQTWCNSSLSVHIIFFIFFTLFTLFLLPLFEILNFTIFLWLHFLKSFLFTKESAVHSRLHAGGRYGGHGKCLVAEPQGVQWLPSLQALWLGLGLRDSARNWFLVSLCVMYVS